jgi:glutathione S-transferase
MKAAGVADGSLPFGQLPQLKYDNGLVLVQSAAILRHLGRTHGAYGKDEAEACRVDIALDGASDMRRPYSKLVYQDALAEGPKAEYAATSLAEWTAHFERFIAANPAGPEWLAASTCTIADYALFDLITTILRTFPDALAAAPLLTAWVARVAARPALAAYIKEDPAHRQVANGNRLG